MSDLNKHIDKVFRDKLGNYRKDPPDEAWTAIREGLGKKSGRKLVLIGWRIAAGFAILITAGYLYYSLIRPANQPVGENKILGVESNVPVEPNYQTTQTEKTNIKDDNSQGDITPGKTSFNAAAVKIAVADLSDVVINTHESVSVGLLQLSPEIESYSKYTVYLDDIPYILKPTKVRPDEIPQSSDIYSGNSGRHLVLEPFDEEKIVKKEIWSITAQMSPVYSYRNLGDADKATVTSLNKAESGMLSYGGGLQLGFKASERLSFYTGLMYSRIGLEINKVISYGYVKNTTYGTGRIETLDSRANIYALNNSTGVVGSNQSNEIVVSFSSANISNNNFIFTKSDAIAPNLNFNDKIEQFFQFLEFPFLLRYKVLNGKLNMNLLGGVSTNILIGNSVFLISGNGKTNVGETEGIRSVNYSGNVGFGLNYDLGKSFLFIFEPQFRYYLNSINEKNLISNRPYSVGMFTGIRYIF